MHMMIVCDILPFLWLNKEWRSRYYVGTMK
jgi:hypothetical protein